MSLEIKNLDVVYGNGGHSIQALEEMDLTIDRGQCLALIGESGSGKTTFGKACLGLLPENARIHGSLSLNGGRIPFENKELIQGFRWKKIAMAFQNGATTLNPSHRVIDQVAEPLVVHGMENSGDARMHAAIALEQMGIRSNEHGKYPHQFSGGQAQKIQLAMAMILDPDVLILDEPTSALDAVSKGLVHRLIVEKKSRGKVIVLITHDLEFAVGCADAVAVLYLGQIMEKLPAKQIFSNPLHPYTLALKRSYPAMNNVRDLGGIRGDAFYRTVHQHGRGKETDYLHSHIQVPESSHKDGHAPPTGCLFGERCTQALKTCKQGPILLENVEDHEVRCIRRGIAARLVLSGVEKRYDGARALHPVTLILKAGEIFSLMGETGSGKTTLAMIAAGVLSPDAGTRYFEERDMDQWIRKEYKSLAGKIGVIYQNPAQSVSHRFTVGEIIAEPLNIHRMLREKKERERRVKECLADVHLSTDDHFLERYPHELNTGALQRICIARALVLNPTLLIADEPTSSLDPSVQAKILKLLLDLQIQKGLTMLFVSHDVGLVRKISDRIGVMYQGRMVETGPASVVLQQPRHPYTRLLIRSAMGEFSQETACEEPFSSAH